MKLALLFLLCFAGVSYQQRASPRFYPRSYYQPLLNVYSNQYANKEFKISHSSFIRCMELSHDETFFIIGGDYEKKENVLKLSMGDLFGSTQTELNNPTVIHSDQYNTGERGHLILCLAISPDDRRIFSSGCSTRVLVHDIQRYVGFVGHTFIIYIIWALLKILFFFVEAKCCIPLPRIATILVESQFSQAATKETYSLLEVTTTTTSAFSIFALAQRVFILFNPLSIIFQLQCCNKIIYSTISSSCDRNSRKS